MVEVTARLPLLDLQNITTAMTSTVSDGEEGELPMQQSMRFPPTPPESDKEDTDSLSILTTEDDCDIPLPPPSFKLTKVLDVDLKTPDSHIPRDPRLLRLTGTHPLNCEPPQNVLFGQGFLTPPELHFVRNHGAVPQVLDEEIPDWDVSIEGLVENPTIFTFRQILDEFEQLTVPITLVCAGNRRKEQNTVRKSNGFSWGPSAVSTSLFTGPMLGDVVRKVKPLRKARYLCMEGADQLPNGNYGTCVKLSWVLSNERGIMLAHKMNGTSLTPDHGRPIRVVVPGVIGGRSVKWLKRIIITDKPSDNWYHKYDNRVLPAMVTPEMAKKDDKWWSDERYAIKDLSVNAAIARPAHEETLKLGDSCPEYYDIQGYAYSGGMRRVTRVELSLDKGKTWELADINYPEDQYRETEHELFGGRLDMATRDACYCWCFWSLPIAVERLEKAEDLVLRAMDESMAIMPRDMYWSVLGMMNNCWFRVSIRKDKEGELFFEHPTHATKSGGWMERVKKEGGDLTGPNWGERGGNDQSQVTAPAVVVQEIKMVNDGVKRMVEIDELRKHDTAEHPWFVVNGEVYDGTAYLDDHPGGASSIIASGGLDATEEFLAIHSESAKAMMAKHHIGTLSEASRLALSSPIDDSSITKTRETFLDPRSWVTSSLIAKNVVSWDTKLFIFKLDHETQRIGLPVGQHLLLKIKDPKGDETIVRAYTPVSSDKRLGVVELLVKIYFDTPTAPGGKMTQAMDLLPINQTVSMKGPIGKFIYSGPGLASINSITRRITTLFMICAGSGITPIFQVLRAALEDPNDTTRCIVLDSNRLEEDILCKSELDAFAEVWVDQLRLVYTLTKPSNTWKGRKGRIDAELIRLELEDVVNPIFLICGPEPLEKSVRGILKGMGWQEGDMVFF